jgi:hypothetical protein
MTDKSAYGVVIGFGGAGLCVLIVALAQLFGQFRHVMPQVREWLIAHGDALGEIIRGALA